MEIEELKGVKAPFLVRQKGKRVKLLKPRIKIIGFSDNDPLDVGFQTVYFEGGGWLILQDFLKNYELANEPEQQR